MTHARQPRRPLLAHRPDLAALAAGLVLLAVVGCAPSEIGGGPVEDDLLGADTGVGHACGTSADCDGTLRCLRLAAEQFCVEPCLADASCGEGLCNPIQGSEVGWCDFAEGWTDEARGDRTPDVPKPPADDPVPDPPVDDPVDPPVDDPVAETRPHASDVPDGTSAPGATCDCDADCGAPEGYEAACIRGLCMVLGDASCSASGSATECPLDARCWEGRGFPICYPDCDANTCRGACDGDGSCVPTASQDCYAACGVLCGRAGQAGGTETPPPDVAPGDCGSATETEQLGLLNQDRAANGLPALQCSRALRDVALAHSQDMAVRGFFSHTNPEGQQPWDRMSAAGINNFRTAGENIAQGQRTPAEVEQSWMSSPGHRANILSPNYTHVGVGAYNGGGQWDWTQLFAAF